jgi:hypothetical protein
MDLYDILFNIIKTKPNYTELSRQSYWSDQLTLRFHKEQLDWVHLSFGAGYHTYTDYEYPRLEFLSKHPELCKYYDWKHITNETVHKIDDEDCSNTRRIPIPVKYQNLPWDSTIMTERLLAPHNLRKRYGVNESCSNCFIYITENPNLPWDWKIASKYLNNPNIKYFIETHHHHDWDWHHLTPIISWKFILNHLEYNWDIGILISKIDKLYRDDKEAMINIYNLKNLKIISNNLQLPTNIQNIIKEYI